MDLKDRKIRVNAVSPGPDLDAGLSKLDLAGGKAESTMLLRLNMAAGVPMGRVGDRGRGGQGRSVPRVG